VILRRSRGRAVAALEWDLENQAGAAFVRVSCGAAMRRAHPSYEVGCRPCRTRLMSWLREREKDSSEARGCRGPPVGSGTEDCPLFSRLDQRGSTSALGGVR